MRFILSFQFKGLYLFQTLLFFLRPFGHTQLLQLRDILLRTKRSWTDHRRLANFMKSTGKLQSVLLALGTKGKKDPERPQDTWYIVAGIAD